jgi:two-component system sensor histidine kinase KdpD
VLESADDVELVDLPPEELLQRLQEGKVYMPEQAKHALESFFRKGNLIALRQLALRRTAERVEAQMQVYRRAHGVSEVWPVAGNLLVAVGPDPTSRRLVRAAKRMADRTGATWTAIAVETPGFAHLSQQARDGLWETLRFAESLGGKTVTLAGTSASEQILAYARTHNVSTIVVGKPTHPRWRDILVRPTVDELVRGSGEIDVVVISGDPEEFRPPRGPAPRAGPRWGAYVAAAVAVAVTTVVAWVLRTLLEPTNAAMVYLLVVVLVARMLGRGPSILASLLSVAAFDFFFVTPVLTFAVSDTQYVLTFAVMLIVALVISTLTTRLHQQAEGSRQRERRTAALYEISRDLVSTFDTQTLLLRGLQHVRNVFDCQAYVLLPDPFGELQVWAEAGEPVKLESQELAVARWVFDNGRIAGAGTTTLAGAKALYLPLSASRSIVGVLGVRPAQPDRLRDPEQLHLLETFANQLAIALERARLAEQARRIRQMEEMDRVRADFLAAASSKLSGPLAEAERRILRLRGELGGTEASRKPLEDAAEALHRVRGLAEDLRELALLEGGTPLRFEPVAPARVVVRTAERFGDEARARDVDLGTEVSPDVPDVRADPMRIEGVLATLVGYALGRTPRGGRIRIAAEPMGAFVQFSVADSGPEIPVELQSGVFDPFAELGGAPTRDGTGLELALVQQVVRAHGGLVWVDSGPGPGCVMSFTLPTSGEETALAEIENEAPEASRD